MATKRSVIGITISLALAVPIALAGSDGSVDFHGLPLFALCGLLAFVVNWIAFVPSYLYRTEHYFDLTGSITYLSVVSLALLGSPELDLRKLAIGFLVVIWALRLGSFLFGRVKRRGADDRFDHIKNNFMAFLMTWTLSGLWVFLTAAAALAAITVAESRPWDWFATAGLSLWIAGFSIEVVADAQKSRFRSQAENRDRFITHGLWAWSRHPNYFGEIVLWIGIATIAVPVLSGWQYVTLVSPIFVWLLLTKVSGIPLLEAKAKKKWGGDPGYAAYHDSTPVLFPRAPRHRRVS